ncbi:MAG: hypothetical protein RL145_1285, partial [Pseudomonadota bacterium]
MNFQLAIASIRRFGPAAPIQGRPQAGYPHQRVLAWPTDLMRQVSGRCARLNLPGSPLYWRLQSQIEDQAAIGWVILLLSWQVGQVVVGLVSSFADWPSWRQAAEWRPSAGLQARALVAGSLGPAAARAAAQVEELQPELAQ